MNNKIDFLLQYLLSLHHTFLIPSCPSRSLGPVWGQLTLGLTEGIPRKCPRKTPLQHIVPPPMSEVFSLLSVANFEQFLTPLPLPIVDVVYEWPLIPKSDFLALIRRFWYLMTRLDQGYQITKKFGFFELKKNSQIFYSTV